MVCKYRFLSQLALEFGFQCHNTLENSLPLLDYKSLFMDYTILVLRTVPKALWILKEIEKISFHFLVTRLLLFLR